MNRPVILKRLGVSLLVGLLLAALISEGSYWLLGERSRPPGRIELLIPAGTAERIAGGQAPPAIPAEMTFVVGDTLVVTNQDSVDHQLGPLWIPPGASASLVLDQADRYRYSCSFQPGSVFGLDVRQPLTLTTRLTGILFAGLPLGALIALYSLVAGSSRKPEPSA
jgi:hypothetical protein